MTGVEQNEGMLKQSKEKTAHLANVEIFQGNILSLPFPDQQFDGVICNQAMKNNNRFFIQLCFCLLVCLLVCVTILFALDVGWHWTHSLRIELVHLSPSRKVREAV